MAPPPPASLPLQQRIVLLAQTLQFAWFGGHVVLLACTLRYCLSFLTFNYYSKMAQFTYRTAFLAAAATYGIVVYKAYRARLRSGRQSGILSIAADENVQYLAMALIWLISRQVGLALLPFTVYSIFHVATYTRANLLPTLQPAPPNPVGAVSPGPSGNAVRPKQSPLADAIGRFVKEYYDSSMMLVAILEIALWFRLVGSALLFSKGALMLLLSYSAFLRARYSQSTFVQNAFSQLSARVDTATANQGTPPAVRQIWNTVKGLGRQAVDATDVSKYANRGAGAPTAGPKKAQ